MNTKLTTSLFEIGLKAKSASSILNTVTSDQKTLEEFLDALSLT